jgi:hypothetical protein
MKTSKEAFMQGNQRRVGVKIVMPTGDKWNVGKWKMVS